MSTKHPDIRHFFDLLHKYNKNQPSISTRLGSEIGRFERFSRRTEGLLVDFSRTGIGEEAFETLMDLVKAVGVEAERDRLFAGAELNFTEHRPVLHPLWRSQNFADLLDPQEAAALCVLMLRGPQTPGELRTNTQRLCELGDLDDVHYALQRLAEHDPPLVTCLPRVPGQKEARYAHLLSGEPDPGDYPTAAPPAPPSADNGLEERIANLEAEVAALRRELAALSRH